MHSTCYERFWSSLPLQAVLRYIQQNASLDPKPSGKKQVFLTVNCRSGGTTNPTAFVKQLAVQNDSENIMVDEQNVFTQLMSKVKEVEAFKIGMKFRDSTVEEPLDLMTKLFNKWLEKYPHKPLPVFCIGEVGCL